MTKVSVLMPVFNAERYVEAAVRSVLGQTFCDFELLVIDDGSTDGSLPILKMMASLDPRIHLKSRSNQGLIATLNELISLSSCALLARMDADDVCRPRRFERQVQFLDSHPGVAAVGSKVLFIDPDGLPLMEAVNCFSHEQIDAELLKPGLGMVHPSVMVRADACAGIGGFRAQYRHAEDLDFFLRLAEFGQLANLAEIQLDYRVHPSSVSHRFFVEQAAAAARAVADALKRRSVDHPAATWSFSPEPIETIGQLHRKWTWWALFAGNLKTARRHARLALAAEPLNPENLRVMACVARDSLKRIF